MAIHTIIGQADEVNKILLENDSKNITSGVIDQSVKNALENRIYFEQWLTRLRKAYKGVDFSYVKELLNLASEKMIVSSAEIYDLAVKYKKENDYSDLVNALKYDGYINNHDDPKIYRFNSNLLREWWKNNVAN